MGGLNIWSGGVLPQELKAVAEGGGKRLDVLAVRSLTSMTPSWELEDGCKDI